MNSKSVKTITSTDIAKRFSFKSTPRIVVNALLLITVLQGISLVSQLFAYQASLHEAIDKVERRISLDSAFLDVGNQTLNTPVNSYAISRYINALNAKLMEESYPVLVNAIQSVTYTSEELDKARYPRSYTTLLKNAEQKIEIEIVSKPVSHALAFSWTALLAALCLVPVFALNTRKTAKQKAQQVQDALPPTPKLIINLQDKTISNGVTDKAVTLQNKPLCFYTALVRFCIENPGHPLPVHKDVPNELIALANRSFGRLIELGHTKRKRPDFNANLDKTLSEIRAALDDVFTGFNEEKETYYPPRAQGEGSRSKQHSYALPKIQFDDIEIIGN